MRTLSLLSVLFPALAGAASAQEAPWATDLYLSGGGHFARRLPVVVRNEGPAGPTLVFGEAFWQVRRFLRCNRHGSLFFLVMG